MLDSVNNAGSDSSPHSVKDCKDSEIHTILLYLITDQH